VARDQSTTKMRWRDRPRDTMLRWGLSRGYGLYVIVAGGAWLLAFEFGWEALSANGRSHGGRLASAGWSVLSLAVALALTRVGWLHLRRPVRRRRDRE